MYLTAIHTYFRLRHNLKKSLDQLKREQWQAFCEMVKYAYSNVPFYRNLYRQTQFSPDDLKTPHDVYSIPTTQKQMFKDSDLNQLLDQGLSPDKLANKRTSGSTGFPLTVYYTPEDKIYRTLLHLRILFANGMGFRDQMLHICDKRDVPDFRYVFQKLGFLPKDFMFCGDPPEQQLQKLATLNPAVIYSYASSMVLIAEEVKKQDKCSFQPRLIFTTGELLHPCDRQKIENAFSVRVRDIYGIVEMGDIAWQCSELNGYHVNIDSFFVEVLVDGRPAQPGEAGKLVITNLHSRAMPFIRYEVGDVVTAPRDTPCPCGCTFPRLDMLEGRADDWLLATDGTRVSPLIFVIASVPGVRQYRMIQKAYDYLVVEILPGVQFNEETLKGVEKHVMEIMGPGMRIEVKRVDQIPRQSGKMKRVFCEIESSDE